MASDQNRDLVGSTKRRLRRKASPNRRRFVAKSPAADLSPVFGAMPLFDRMIRFDMIGFCFSFFPAATSLGR